MLSRTKDSDLAAVSLLACSVMSDSLWPHGLYPARLFYPWDFLSKNTGVGCHVLLHEGILHCRRILICWAIWEALGGSLLGSLLYIFREGRRCSLRTRVSGRSWLLPVELFLLSAFRPLVNRTSQVYYLPWNSDSSKLFSSLLSLYISIPLLGLLVTITSSQPWL